MKAVFSLVLLSCVVAVLSASHQESEERNVARAARAADPVADRALQKARRRKQAKKARKSGKKGKKAIRRGKGKRPGKKSGKKARKSGKKGKKSGKKARKSGKKGKKSGKKAKKSGKKAKKSGKKAKKSGKKGKKSGKKGKKAKKAKKAKKSGKKARKSGKKGKKSGKKATKTMKQGGRPKGAVRSGQASGRVLKGNGCEYVSLTDIKTKGTSCTNGYKFVLKGATNTRRQFLIVNDLVILAFVTANTKFPACTSFKDVTADVTCKAVTGLDSTDLSASGTATTASSETTTTTTTTTTAAAADDVYVTRVKGYIDAGTCSGISSTSNCGSSATSYYKTFTYNGKRIIISSQVPDHDAEHDQLVTNPNTRCERWQYISLPIDPTKASSSSATGLGTVGLAVTGGAFFNDLSSPQGDLAMYNEGSSLDSCFGHSAPGGAYHYHANINCTSAGAATGANNPDTCLLIGYMNDGVPVYGFCKTSAGVQMTSCYKVTSGATTGSVTTVGGTYDNIGTTQSSYEYDSAAFTAGTCNLDEGNGAIHPTTGKYSYFTTNDYPYVPILVFGNSGASSLCSAA